MPHCCEYYEYLGLTQKAYFLKIWIQCTFHCPSVAHMVVYQQHIQMELIYVLLAHIPTLQHLQAHDLFHLHRWCKHHCNVSTEPKQTLRRRGRVFLAEPHWIPIFYLCADLFITCGCFLLYNQRLSLSLNMSQCSIKQALTLRLFYSFILRLSVLSKKNIWNFKRNFKTPSSPDYLTI